MAITLQLATALQKTTPPSTVAAVSAAGAAANTASDDAPAAVPFATLIDDLLRPLDAAQAAIVADAAPAGDLPADAAAASNAAADAATQALLASLLLPAPPLTPTAIAAGDTPEAAGASVALPPTTGQMTADDPLASDVALLTQGKNTAAAQDLQKQASAPTLTPAPTDQSLPQVAANLAAPGVDPRLRSLMPERAVREDVQPDAVPLTELGQTRAATPAAPLAASAPSSAAASVVQYSIPEPVAGSRWADALGQRAMFLVDQQIKSAELHLNPPNLGPLEVKLALDGDKATLSFTTNQAAVREAVQQSLPRLQQVFADNGMAELNVQVHLGQQQQPQQQERQAGESAQGGNSSGSSMPLSDIQMQVQASRWHSQSHAAARGGVDIFA